MQLEKAKPTLRMCKECPHFRLVKSKPECNYDREFPELECLIVIKEFFRP